jgi:hypothetical protein
MHKFQVHGDMFGWFVRGCRSLATHLERGPEIGIILQQATHQILALPRSVRGEGCHASLGDVLQG